MGWVRAPRDQDKPFLLPSTHDLPELGRKAGEGGTVNLKVLLAAQPDLIVDFGTVDDSCIDLAKRVQEQNGVPQFLIGGTFANTPAAIRQLAEAPGVPERGEDLAAWAQAQLARVDTALAEV